MIHKLSVMATEYCIDRQWINSSVRAWSIYAFEKKILSLFFYVILCLSICITRKPLETVIFSVASSSLRRRIGGWHANKPLNCQILSITIVLLVVMLCGPLMMRMQANAIYCIDFIVMIIARFTSPCYSPQLNFSADETAANTKKKNQLIGWIIVIQVVSLVACEKVVVVYSLLGVLTGVLSVYIEKFRQRIRKDEKNYESKRKYR